MIYSDAFITEMINFKRFNNETACQYFALKMNSIDQYFSLVKFSHHITQLCF